MSSTLTPSRSTSQDVPVANAAPRPPALALLRRNFLSVDVLILGFVASLLLWIGLSQVAPGLRLYAYDPQFQWAERNVGRLVLELSVYFLLYLGMQRLGIRYHRDYFTQGLRAPRWLAFCNVVYVFLPVVFIPFIFNLLGAFIAGISGVPGAQSHPAFDPAQAYDRAATWWDLWLKDLDIRMLGVYPPEWMRKFHAPWLSGLMMVAYLSYYVSPLVAVVPQVVARNWAAVRRIAAVYAGCLLLTYVGYILLPATGPRFEGGPGAWLPAEPGWFAAEWWAVVLNDAEIIRWDAFPSGHVAVALVALVLSMRYHRRIGLAYLPFVAGLTVATVYLGYHYAFDVVVGIALAAFAFLVLEPAIRWWESIWTPTSPT